MELAFAFSMCILILNFCRLISMHCNARSKCVAWPCSFVCVFALFWAALNLDCTLLYSSINHTGQLNLSRPLDCFSCALASLLCWPRIQHWISHSAEIHLNNITPRHLLPIQWNGNFPKQMSACLSTNPRFVNTRYATIAPFNEGGSITFDYRHANRVCVCAALFKLIHFKFGRFRVTSNRLPSLNLWKFLYIPMWAWAWACWA